MVDVRLNGDYDISSSFILLGCAGITTSYLFPYSAILRPPNLLHGSASLWTCS